MALHIAAVRITAFRGVDLSARPAARLLALPLTLLLAMLPITLAAPQAAWAQKYGGVLRGMLREMPSNFAPLETNVTEPVITSAPIYNNLVVFDPLQEQESLASVIPDLAEKWTWSEGGKHLTFTLRRGVKWQDGKPFTSADVKHTLDLLRGTSAQKLRLNPRKTWFWNVKDVQVRGDYEVTLVLGAIQPSLLALLASHLVPMVPAHVDSAELRTKPMGTGPFRIKEVVPDQRVVLEKNPGYWMQGRPYLDGLEFIVIKSRPSRLATLSLGQVDFSYPLEMTVNARDTLKKAVPAMRFQEQSNNSNDNILINPKRPPFDNPSVRQALNLALDRKAFIHSIYQDAAFEGGMMTPKPFGVWGLTPEEVATLPGFGDAAKNRAEARRIMQGLGYGPERPLKITISTRAVDIYVDTAVWVVSQLKEIYIDAALEQIETAAWHPKLVRRDFQVGVNVTSGGVDDPDAILFENYLCGSERNYSDYCNDSLTALYYAQSAEQNPARRLELVKEIDRRLQTDGARPILAHKLEIVATWPYVRNLIAHQSVFNHWRFQEVWLDK